jgi:hypothetical protein
MVPVGDEYAVDRHPNAERGVVRPVHDVYAFMCLPFMVPWLGQAEDGEALPSCTTVSFLQIAAVARRALEILGAGNCLIVPIRDKYAVDGHPDTERGVGLCTMSTPSCVFLHSSLDRPG